MTREANRAAAGAPRVRFAVVGMDCASCAAKVEKAARAAGALKAEVSTTTQVLEASLPSASGARARLEEAVRAAGYDLEPAGDASAARAAHRSPGYRRALWIVIALNLGYGVVEMIGGFVAGSQALKADALDFLGDGAITLLGLLAIGWSVLWRARAALLQGLFLGTLGLGVVATTVRRVFDGAAVEAGLMGALGIMALAANLAAAAVLLPHRSGDANVRAVWLFSRNDAIGNGLVVAAAGLVAVTGTAWPDLVVALLIAGLFLQSSWVIVRDARRELRRH